MRLISLALGLAATLAAAAPATAADPRIAVSPRVVDRDETQRVTGRGWPVIEFCRRTVEVKLKSDQNRVRLGTARVRRSGRFAFTWNPEDANAGAGRWRLVVRMQCESGDDGSALFQKRTASIRIRG